MYTKQLTKILVISSLLMSTTIYAKSCEKKWAEYYAGKSWFEPWCDTESYKRSMEDNSYPDILDADEAREIDEALERAREEKANPLWGRVKFSNPTYIIEESCSPKVKIKEYTPKSCVDIFGKITFTSPKNNSSKYENKTEINSVMLKCNIEYTTEDNNKKTIASQLYIVSTGNVFSEYIQENETRELQLYEAEFYASWKRPKNKNLTRRTVNSPHTLNLLIRPKEINIVDCSPIYAK